MAKIILKYDLRLLYKKDIYSELHDYAYDLRGHLDYYKSTFNYILLYCSTYI